MSINNQHKIREIRSSNQRPSESILSSQSWAYISLFIDLPTIDDSYHGIDIYGYQDELEVLGVVIGFEEGAHFVLQFTDLPFLRELESQWKDILQFTDLPFPDEIYYGNRVSEYEDELQSIEVKVS